MNTNLRGKRKKKKNTCPNPLFVKWLTEWRDDAAEKGLKSQYCYRKALASLKKYPLVFTSGKECKVLENFGDKICKMLDTKLARHISEHGDVIPVDPEEDLPSTARKPSKPARRQGAGQQEGELTPAVTPLARIHSISDDEGGSSGHQPKARRRSHSSGEREYIPAYRSGPYAILLTLYANYQRAHGRGFMSKVDLMREAQHLADKSFTVADPGCRYTAWSSMGTLIRKGFVIKESSPARYSITASGCVLAAKLEGVDATGIGVRESSAPSTAVFPAVSPPRSITTTLTSISREPDLPSLPDIGGRVTTSTVSDSGSSLGTLGDNRLQFWYITESGTKTRDKNRAAVIVDDSVGIGFLISCKYQDLLRSGHKYKLDMSRPLTDDHMFAYLEDSAAGDIAPVPPDSTKVKDSLQPPALGEPQHKGNQQNVTPDPVSEKMNGQRKVETISVEPGAVVPERLGSCLSDRLGLPSGSSALSSAAMNQAPASPVDRKPVTSTSPLFSLRPGTFDIVLCVDNQEFYGKTSSGGKTLFAELIKNGISCDLRKLQVGDFLWVAREKGASQPGGQFGGGGVARELVLDHIIERKRMDDLVSSCIDGRFKEQKFRLKRCGLRCPIYLIEDYGSVQNFSMPEDRLKQTIANTQVVDGFQVKRTGDNRESVAYLTIMTRYLQSHYQDKTLDAFPGEILADICGPYNISDPHQRLMEFREFNEASVKTKNLSIREMFGKQIIQMYRLSAEGAKAILDQYPTPSHLIGAYDDCGSEKEKEELLSKIKSGKAGRSLGVSVSRQFYQLYCTNSPLT